MVFAIAVITTSAISSVASDDIDAGKVRLAAALNLACAERVVTEANFAIEAVAPFVGDTEQQPAIIHAELRRFAELAGGVRAMIVLDGDGKLKHDSFRYPAATLDLSDREYFKKAISTDELVIGKTVIGRTTSVPFEIISPARVRAPLFKGFSLDVYQSYQ